MVLQRPPLLRRERAREGVAVGIGEGRFARALDRSGGGAVAARECRLDERRHDCDEIAEAALMGVAVAFDEAPALRDLEGERGIERGSAHHRVNPALDASLLLGEAMAASTPGLESG